MTAVAAKLPSQSVLNPCGLLGRRLSPEIDHHRADIAARAMQSIAARGA
jgi:hypothetical protein